MEPESDRLIQEISAVRVRTGKALTTVKANKFTFLTSSHRDTHTVAASPDEEFLGYATLVYLPLAGGGVSYVLESVIREPSVAAPSTNAPLQWDPLLNNYLHVHKEFSCTVAGANRYKLQGTFFCQQNSVTSVCANACAAMVLSNCSEVPGIVTCETVNRLLNIDHRQRMFATRWAPSEQATHEGLSMLELQAVFRRSGFGSFKQDFLGDTIRYYREFLYGFIESGYPALLSFTTKPPAGELTQHVVPVFGHTLNSDSWFPPAFSSYVGQSLKDWPYLSTVGWVSDFIIHDDNFGMYFCLPGHSFRPEGHPDPGVFFTPGGALGLFPEAARVNFLSQFAERAAVLQLSHLVRQTKRKRKPYYCEHLFESVVNGAGVFRTALVKREDYLKHLGKTDYAGHAFTDDDKAAMEGLLKHRDYFWLAEVTEPDLYIANKSKVVDVLLDPQVDPKPERFLTKPGYGVLFLRLPGSLIVYKRGNPTKVRDLSVSSHYPLLTRGSSRPSHTVW